MDENFAKKLVQDTLPQPFNKGQFIGFVKELLNEVDESKSFHARGYIPEIFKDYIKTYERIGTYLAPQNRKIDILIVYLQQETTLARARTAQRNFIARYLRDRGRKDAGLVAFVSPDSDDWRFSFVKMEYTLVKTPKGDVKPQEELTPARRYSFLVGKNENSHTAQKQLLPILQDDQNNPSFSQIENIFNIEVVTKEFFGKYRELFLKIKEDIEKIIEKDETVKKDFAAKEVSAVDFSKKLLGQIVFLYFLQKKGWFGVGRGKEWGSGSKHFLRELFEKKHSHYQNFFNDILEPLFYEALREDRSHNDDYFSQFKCRIPFLNGGLFDPLNNYDWVNIDILLPDELFSNDIKTKEGDKGTGILDVFDRYNFTVKEDEPLEKEVAVDPEMLGKVFENLLEVKDRKSKGTYYTPREIVHYMCQESLINYLSTQQLSLSPLAGTEQGEGDAVNLETTKQSQLTKEDITAFIKYGETTIENELVAIEKQKNIKDGKQKTTSIESKLPPSIVDNALLIDNALKNIRVCDPAVGSGAFPVGMMNEIIRARNALTPYIFPPPLLVPFRAAGREQGEGNAITSDISPSPLMGEGRGEGEKATKRTPYNFKRHAIQNCLYGVDIDPGAVEITKLRLWLSLIVDEEDIKNIKPLPNLDYKIVCGNSLLGVERDLFNEDLFKKLEELKLLYFNETDPTKKQECKKQIDNLIREITNNNENFDFEVYFSEVFHGLPAPQGTTRQAGKGGFDVVIANPPYGFRNVLTAEERKYFRKEKGIQFPSGDIAELFILTAYNSLVRQKGTQTFIIPKKSLYGESWKNVRKLWTSTKLLYLMDASKAFEQVLLEQVSFSLMKEGSPDVVSVGALDQKNDRIQVFGKFSLEDIFTEDLRNAQIYRGLYQKQFLQKISAHSITNTAELIRGEIGVSNITSDLTFEPKGNYPCVKGIDIIKYGLKRERYLRGTVAQKYLSLYQDDKIVAQEIIAHIQNPLPHIIITMFYNDSKRLLHDTCVEIKILDPRLSKKFLLGYFQSAFCNWYAHNLIYNRAIRTMHFINYYITQIPIPSKILEGEKAQKPFITLVDKILAITSRRDYDPKANSKLNKKVHEYEKQINEMVYKLYDLTDEEIKIVENFKQ